MSGMLKPALVVFILAPAVIICPSGVQAQSTAMVPLPRVVAPLTVPAESNRLRVFISNAGSIHEPPAGWGLSITGGPGQAYNKFYAAVETSGQYQPVTSPSEADVVLEFSFVDPRESDSGRVTRDLFNKKKFPPEKVLESDIPRPIISLVIFDPRTHGVYGRSTERFKIGHTQEKRDEILSSAIKLLVGQAASVLDRSPQSGDVPRHADDAPAPSQIRSAKTVFIANAGTSPVAYNHLYSLMQGWGGYQVLPSTDGADLIFQVSADPWLRVAIVDPHTGVTLRAFTPSVGVAVLKRNVEKDIDKALTGILREIATMSGRPAPVKPKDAKEASAQVAPIPPQLLKARTVFISNAGIEPLLDLKDNPLEIYSTFCATMQDWARFQLAPAPSEADLLFEISVPSGKPILILRILDPATQADLWEFRQEIHGRVHGTIEEQKNVDTAVAELVASVARLIGQPDARISVPSKTQVVLPPRAVTQLKKAFISKPRSEDDFFESRASGQFYTQLVESMKSWGYYELTPPKDADLILEPSAWGTRVQLTVRDAKTRHILWTYVHRVKTGFFNLNDVNHYKTAIDMLVNNMRRTASNPSHDTAGAVESH